MQLARELDVRMERILPYLQILQDSENINEDCCYINDNIAN
jgi:hypothetical protein